MIVRLLVILILAKAVALEDWALGMFGPLTSVSQHFLAAAILFDLDLRKLFNDSIRQRFGPPIIIMPSPHPLLKNISVRIGNSASVPSTGMNQALNFFFGRDGKTPISALVGEYHSSISMPVASLGGTLQVPQISYASTNPSLSNKVQYPFFLRTIPTDAVQGKAMWCWMNTFSIPSVLHIYSLEPYAEGLFGVVADQAKAARRADAVLGLGYPFLPGSFWNETAVASSLEPALSSGRKFIILVSADDVRVGPVLAALGLFDDHQILGAESSTPRLFPVGFQYFSPMNRGSLYPKFEQMWSNMTAADCYSPDAVIRYSLDHMVIPLSESKVPMLRESDFADVTAIDPYTPFLFDAMYSFALAVNVLLNEGQNLTGIRGEVLLAKVKVLNFEGVSGTVSFDSSYDREAAYLLLNKRTSIAAVATTIGLYDSKTNHINLTEIPLWMDGSRNNLAPLSLLACKAGFYSNNQSGLCDPCQKGFWCAGGMNSVYTPCARGSFADSGGTINCTVCSPGRFVAEAGSSESYPCLKGYYAASYGMDTCARCSKGSYAEYSGATACLPCDGNKVTAESGADNTSLCVCDDGFFLNSEICVPCKEGMKCWIGLGEPDSLPGFWIDPGSVADGSYSIFSCRPFQCPGGPAGTCAEGRVSTACNNCKDNHYPRSGGTCKECSGSDAAILTSAFVAIVLLVTFGLGAASSDLSQQSLQILSLTLVFSQLIMAIQALGSIQQIDIDWVDPAKSVLSLTKLLTFDFDVVHMSCLQKRDDPVIKMVFQLIAFPFCVSVVCASWGISKLCRRLYKKALSLDNVFNLCGMLLFAFFISITLSVLLPFQCLRNPNGKLTMVSNPGLVCFHDKDHISLVVLAVIGIVIYPVSTLVFTVHVVLKHPSQIASGSGLQAIARYRFLFQRFQTERYYYGLVLLFRNTFVALIPVVLAGFPAIQTLCMGALLLAASSLQIWFKPWRTRIANIVDVIMGTFLILVVLCGALFVKSVSVESARIIGICVLLAVVSPPAALVILFVYLFWRKIFGKRPYGAFLCHHKGGAGVLARLMKLMLMMHSKDDIFLDCDQLEDLDLLFDAVRTDTNNLFIILTQELLRRMWCAGEIVTAHRNRVRMVPIVCPGFTHPSYEELINFPDVWTEQQKHVLSSNGINLEHIMPAFLFVQQLPHIDMPRYATLNSQELACIEIIAAGHLKRRAFTEVGKDSHTASILVTGWIESAEELSLCYVVQLMVQRETQKPVVVVRSEDEVLKFVASAKHLLVLLGRNLLQDPCFARILLRAVDYRLAFVPVSSDTNFQFPTAEFYDELKLKGLDCEGLGVEVGPSLSNAMRQLMTILAWPLSPLGSEGLLSTQVSQICRRFREGKLPVKTVDSVALTESKNGFYRAAALPRRDGDGDRAHSKTSCSSDWGNVEWNGEFGRV